MTIKKHGSAHWQGGLKDGKGSISTESGALDGYPYGFAQRFEGVKGSNPEELIGAAHASCFSMALSKILGEAGFTADSIQTSAEVSLEEKDGGFSVTGSHLKLKANDSRHGPAAVQGSSQQGQGRLSDQQTPGYKDHA